MASYEASLLWTLKAGKILAGLTLAQRQSSQVSLKLSEMFRAWSPSKVPTLSSWCGVQHFKIPENARITLVASTALSPAYSVELSVQFRLPNQSEQLDLA